MKRQSEAMKKKKPLPRLEKAPTGIYGFDEITYGGLPRNRPSLVAGRAGCGKTLFGMEFLVRGALEYHEPGVMISFEESIDDMIKNFASLGFDLNALMKRKLLNMDYVAVERSEIEETGEYSLEGLFIRLEYAINSVGARRIVLDTIETLFSGLQNEMIIRAELRRLFRWLKMKKVTAVITAEQGKETLTRHGLEEYVADCVIFLDHTVNERIATRRLRVIKYRGSSHGTDEYPFLIDENGMSVLPVSSISLDHTVSDQRFSTGIQRLDAMLEGKGFYRGSSILISGSAGTGKTTLSASFVNQACKRGEKVLYFAFEESPQQICRNMHSVGIDLERHLKSGQLKIHAARPTIWGLELHLATMHKIINSFKPKIVVVDPISNLTTIGTSSEVQSMFMRLIDFMKVNQITAFFTDLTTNNLAQESSNSGISSLMDVWIFLRDIESNGERTRGLYVLKARGIKHSNQIREFLITSNGIYLIDVYTGTEGVLTGTARMVQEAKEKTERLLRQQEIERKHRELKVKEEMIEKQIFLLKERFEMQKEETLQLIEQAKLREDIMDKERAALARVRQPGSKTSEK